MWYINYEDNQPSSRWMSFQNRAWNHEEPPQGTCGVYEGGCPQPRYNKCNNAPRKANVLNHNLDKCAIMLWERWMSYSNQVLRRWIHERGHQIHEGVGCHQCSTNFMKKGGSPFSTNRIGLYLNMCASYSSRVGTMYIDAWEGVDGDVTRWSAQQ